VAVNHGGGTCPATDQRGESRPRPVGSACDAGAYESDAGTVPPVSLLVNPSFEIDTNADFVPDGWIAKKFQAGGVEGVDCTTPADAGSCSLKMVADSKGAQLMQDLSISGGVGETITLDYATMGQLVGGKGSASVKLTVYYTKGSKSVQFKIPVGDHTWTDRTLSVITTKSYKKVRVTIKFSRKQGSVWFDEMVLTR
jgi:hypothetical protein